MKPRNAFDIVNRATCYEIVATDGADTLRLAFSARQTRERLLANMRGKAAEIVARFNLGSEAEIGAYSKAQGWSVHGNGRTVYVRFSGRTERECYWTEAAA